MKPDATFEGAKCIRCRKQISVVYRYEGGKKFEEQDLESRFIDQWGCSRNFCKDCMKKGKRNA